MAYRSLYSYKALSTLWFTKIKTCCTVTRTTTHLSLLPNCVTNLTNTHQVREPSQQDFNNLYKESERQRRKSAWVVEEEKENSHFSLTLSSYERPFSCSWHVNTHVAVWFSPHSHLYSKNGLTKRTYPVSSNPLDKNDMFMLDVRGK